MQVSRTAELFIGTRVIKAYPAWAQDKSRKKLSGYLIYPDKRDPNAEVNFIPAKQLLKTHRKLIDSEIDAVRDFQIDGEFAEITDSIEYPEGQDPKDDLHNK